MPAARELVDDLATYRKPLSLLQLADVVGVTRRTLYTHVEKGALKVIKRGGVIRVTPSEARRYAGIPEPARTASKSRRPR